ncbi:MAG: hypothetical protein A2583_15110 [Bdellovibrionales bacterium RIFOXYD1_FULL_53_11]|nr:MAG: hypothetical protein A2583_15110 [Bdellovibrionales bacterium RIFOXYD1_FULL_53_11]
METQLTHGAAQQKYLEILRRVECPERDRHPLHKLYSYPAKFQASVPELIIEGFSGPGDIVLDPFGGGGTVSVSCRLMGRSSVHYDLSPLACLVTLAKTTFIEDREASFVKSEFSAAAELAGAFFPAAARNASLGALFDAEERHMMGSFVAEAAEGVWQLAQRLKDAGSSAAPLVACLLVRFLKLCGRRDAVERRDRPVRAHLEWFMSEYAKYAAATNAGGPPRTIHAVRCASNHQLELEDRTVALVVTSPPYSGVDIEYSEIQIQRRDIGRCYRSLAGVRVANLFFEGAPTKRGLCDGGVPGVRNYPENARRSLLEMQRVMIPGAFAFVYCGFKDDAGRDGYEKLLAGTGFELVDRIGVRLSADRGASSRSLHHGRDTNMMGRDWLFIARKV